MPDPANYQSPAGCSCWLVETRDGHSLGTVICEDTAAPLDFYAARRGMLPADVREKGYTARRACPSDSWHPPMQKGETFLGNHPKGKPELPELQHLHFRRVSPAYDGYGLELPDHEAVFADGYNAGQYDRIMTRLVSEIKQGLRKPWLNRKPNGSS